jgi:hypothetical protein
MKKARDVIEPTMVVGKLKFRVRRSGYQWRLSKKTQRTRAFWQELLRRVPLPPSRFLINGRNGIVGQAENMEAWRGKAAEADACRRHRGYGPRGSGEGNGQRTNSTERLIYAVIPRTNLDGHCKLP